MTTLDNAQAVSAAAALRHLAIGDVWEYEVEGSVTRGGDPRNVSGTIVVSVERDLPSASSMMLVFRQGLFVEGDSIPMPAGIFIFKQDRETGDLSIAGDNMGVAGGRRVAFRPQLFYPGRWSTATAYDNRLEFEGGAFVRNTLAVTGQESVATPLGVYPAWVARFSSEGSSMGCLAGTDWWAPELGAPVRFETHSTAPDGSTMRICASIRVARLADLGSS